MRTYLQIPYADRLLANSRGARWDGITGRWYVQDMEDLKPVMEWTPAALLRPTQRRAT